MTMTANQKIADALRKCKRHLWDGTGHRGRRHAFICYALLETTCDGVELGVITRAQGIVTSRVRGKRALSVPGWLLENGHIGKDDYCVIGSYALFTKGSAPKIVRQIQAYRHAWVDSLIEEFSK